jgi:hypothetical protein
LAAVSQQPTTREPTKEGKQGKHRTESTSIHGLLGVWQNDIKLLFMPYKIEIEASAFIGESNNLRQLRLGVREAKG